MSRAGGCGCNQLSHPPRQRVGNGRGADEPRGAAAHRLPNRCQPLPGRTLQFAAARGTGKKGRVPGRSLNRYHEGCDQIFNFLLAQAGLSHEELSVAVEMLSAVAVLNEVLDTKDLQAVIEQLTDSPLGFSNMDQENLNRYTS